MHQTVILRFLHQIIQFLLRDWYRQTGLHVLEELMMMLTVELIS